VEVGVQVVQRWVLAALRKRQFFSLAELFRARSIAEQMGKDLLRNFHKELAFFILGGLEE
jgi:hypothetical protein